MNASDNTSTTANSGLKKTLGPVTLWGLGVGYVISGEYFGWNLGLPAGGTLGMLTAFVLVSVMYVTFVFSYTEMACAIPRAGGVFVYGVRGLGLLGGYLGGLAQLIEFVFAPPAIAMAIAGYAQTIWPAVDQRFLALAVFLLFTLLNIWGVRQAAVFELIVAAIAVAGLVLFAVLAAPHFEWSRFAANGWPHGWGGVLASLPFAIWFYLAIEGVANAAEEARNPQRDVALGFGSAILTLVVLAGTVLFLAPGIGGWEQVVYAPADLVELDTGGFAVRQNTKAMDSPLPLALGQVMSSGTVWYRLLVGIGVLGFVASLNGIILVAGRSLFEMGRVGFLPRLVGTSHPRTRTPVAALVLNLLLGGLAILFLNTQNLITMSAIGATMLYVISMCALLRLRKVEPDLPRPFRVPCYPVFPLVAMLLALVAFVAMVYLNFDYRQPWTSISVWYFGILGAALLYYVVVVVLIRHLTAEDFAHFHHVDS